MTSFLNILGMGKEQSFTKKIYRQITSERLFLCSAIPSELLSRIARFRFTEHIDFDFLELVY